MHQVASTHGSDSARFTVQLSRLASSVWVHSHRSVHGASRLANGSLNGSTHGGGSLALQADGSSRGGAKFLSAAALDGSANTGYGQKPPGFVLPGQGGPLQDNAGVRLHSFARRHPGSFEVGDTFPLHIGPWDTSGSPPSLCTPVPGQCSSGAKSDCEGMTGCQEFRDEVDAAWLQISESDLEAQTPRHRPLVQKAVVEPARGACSLLMKLLRQWRGVGVHPSCWMAL